MAASTSSSEAQVRVVSFSVSPSNVKLSGGSMTVSGHGIAMTTLVLTTIVIFNSSQNLKVSPVPSAPEDFCHGKNQTFLLEIITGL